eukprot:TRINITY_DN29947_c0_g1_i1.p1 TRINITY_DN29947_c0_g1~~TRINITY_DN29947_c0_g1_i1.p1  ORF type:complete len:794 (+),score=426.61 TRINITY_DN29947_c0_g1_i1:72-2453(+)
MADKVAAPVLTPEEQQEKWLMEANTVVRQHAGSMRRALEGRHLQEVLKHASLMLAELRTSQLSPQNYYELYVLVTDELQELERYFEEEVTVHGRSVEELYEIVQHAGFIVPRLYLLITVGSVYIKTKAAPAKDILKDLVEMCKGVQHPTRGLFLRHYLSTITKNKLPDAENEYIGEGGSVVDSVDFVLQNFKEMVWLWVRIEQKQVVACPERRAKERESLRLLVGFNLMRLGQLDGIDLNMYVDHVMPRVIEVIANSKDVIAQQYLSEVMIQVFPDEFHLARLSDLLSLLTTQLNDGVNLQSILTGLMDRLARYAETDTGEKKKKWERNALSGMFESFQTAISELTEMKPRALDNVKYVHTMMSLLHLSLKAYPDNTERVDEVFTAVAQRMEGQDLDNKTVNLVKKMLTAPVEHYGNMAGVLDLNGWPVLLHSLNDIPKREVARDLCTYSLKSGEPLASVEHVMKVFEFIQPLIEGEVADDDDDYDEFEDDQTLVAKMLHLFESDTLEVQFKMYSACRKQFGKGGEKRIKFTLPPLVFCFLKLAMRVKKAIDAEEDVGKVKVEKILEYVGGILEVLSNVKGYGKLSLNLYLQAARTADKCNQPEKCASLMDCALIVYEEEISADSKEQMVQLPVMISTVTSLKRLDEESQDKLCSKLCAYSSRLLKKADQCHTVFLCSHLFHKSDNEEKRKKVQECLQRSLKLVDQCPDSLLVDILNRYAYFFSNCNENVTAKHINVLIGLVNAKLNKDDEDGPGGDDADENTKQYYENTLEYIRNRQSKGDEGQRWHEVQLS